MGFAKHCKRREISLEDKYLLMTNMMKSMNRERSKEWFERRMQEGEIYKLKRELREVKGEDNDEFNFGKKNKRNF